MGIADVVSSELKHITESSPEYFIVSPDTFPNVNRNILHPFDPSRISSIHLFKTQTKESPVPELFIMIPALIQPIGLSVKSGFFRETTVSVQTELEFPLFIYIGGIVEGGTPHTIVLAHWKMGFRKSERIFLPLTSEKLNGKLAKKVYQSQRDLLGQVDCLNSDMEINGLLNELQSDCNYDVEIAGDSVDTKISPKFQSFLSESPSLTDRISFGYHEGLVCLFPLDGNKVAVTVASAPKSINFPCQIFSEFDNLWIAYKQGQNVLLEELLMARKILLSLFTPYEFELPHKVKILELVAETIKRCIYDGEVKSRYIPESGVSDFLNAMTKPINGTRKRIAPTVTTLSKDEFMKNAAQYVVNLQINLVASRSPFNIDDHGQ